MQTLQRARNVWRLNSQISQDGTFVHYPFFVLNIPLFTFSYRIFSRYLFVLTYFDSSRRHTNATTHATGTQIVRAKMTSLDAIFCWGNKSSSCSLARFCRRKQKLYRSRFSLVKNLSSTCRQVYNIANAVLRLKIVFAILPCNSAFRMIKITIMENVNSAIFTIFVHCFRKQPS